MYKLLMLFLCASWSMIGVAQQRKVVTGAVQDSLRHDPVSGVKVTVWPDTASVQTNQYGLFRIEVPNGSTHLVFEHPAYVSKSVPLQHDRMLIELSPLKKSSGAGNEIATAKARARYAASSNPNYSSLGVTITSFFDETYGRLYENKFVETRRNAVSDFALDVDRAAYSNMRRFARLKQPVPVDAVRIEEMLNYFHYNYPLPRKDSQFAMYSHYTGCPWEPRHNLLQVAVRARKIETDSLPASNLVFLIDCSGSMGPPNKLPLLQAAFRVLVNNLRPRDKVAIVAYAGTPGLVLPCTPGNQKEKILHAIDYLSAGGATGGEAAIKMAYHIAGENFIPGGNNRVIMATDGDFNVGQTSDQDMEDLIEQQKEGGVLLTCLGFGMKDYKDSKLETLASKGNGNFAYIDDLEEANKVFAREFGSTLFTVAREVHAQVTFDARRVKAYRLLGYENKILKEENGDSLKVAGGIVGSGHCVVAMYEIEPANPESDGPLATVSLTWRPDGEAQQYQLEKMISSPVSSFDEAPDDCRFAASVALFGMLLRKSQYAGNGSVEMVTRIAKRSLGPDPGGYRGEFLKLIKQLKKHTPWLK
ncbi:vWA domain-containing protein [Chitinophaga rhizosphaerae]|uniref:vWA domain-containing protein n=1 Tax=Chitinophaga rhizosphaerae TaxID=1864947 RepID=UPI000F802F9F|nr:VWA domain-containing protein [Chitinophaga rhizosphaerae]